MRRLRPPPMEPVNPGPFGTGVVCALAVPSTTVKHTTHHSRSSSSSAQRRSQTRHGSSMPYVGRRKPSPRQRAPAQKRAEQRSSWLAGSGATSLSRSRRWQSASFWQCWPTRRPDRWQYPPLNRGRALFNPGWVPSTTDAGTSVSLPPAARAGATAVELQWLALAGCQHAGEVELNLILGLQS